MANYVVFLDHEHAKIFLLTPDGTKEEHMKREHHHANHSQHKHPTDGVAHKAEEAFFQDVAKKISAAHEILLVGPGTAKTQFKHHLEKHHNDSLSKKIVGVETVDHPTDNQIVALGKKFFKAHLRFE